MSQRSDEEELRRDYLLGELVEEQREEVEERLLLDDDFEERLSETQDALIDAYVFGTLPASQRESFDKNFVINDERREKLLFARALEIYVDRPQQGEPRHDMGDGERLPPAPVWSKPWQFIRAHKAWAGVAALAVLLVWLAPATLKWFRPPAQVALVRERRANIERRVAEVNGRPADRSIQALPASELELQSTILREGGGLKRADLTDDLKLLKLRLALSQARHESYRALVLTVEGEELFAADGLASEVDAGGPAVRLNLPTEFIPAGDYQIQLWGRGADGGLTEVGRYSFRVVKKK